MNRALTTAVFTIGLAQLAKVPLAYQQTGRWDWSNAFRTGGMPSSHSAGVASLAAYVGLKRGITSVHFATASMLGLIVMFDAMGIRRQAGIIATEVNELGNTVAQLAESAPPYIQAKRQKRLEERLGHLPEEVLGGALMGMFTGAFSYVMEPRPPKRRWLPWP
ncbi:Divergent PAP2 family protein [Paenibacillus konkukensis]|uniref:Divergent PAP2 family protein n=1 Tax=Paenibacillus konkukensis TaxID=2020716 RepID=A0ABY4RXS3_9BACL|nr:divergent PAP2 family protein [Paenibacillus konkukensis]UQZ87156.1 Divergent PAP2 family protein [Paenibacillus konkukensis]